MNSEASAEKFRRKSSRLPSESKSQPLNLVSGNRDKSSASRLSVLHGEQQKLETDSSSKHWTLKQQGFPPGVTVDELKHYRRRRQTSDVRPQDNLQPEEGSVKSYQSEYKYRFGSYKPGETEFDSEKDLSGKNSEDKGDKEKLAAEEKKESHGDLQIAVVKKGQSSLNFMKDQPFECVTENNSNYIPYINPERPKPLRRSTALKPEGSIMAETEVRSQFRMYDHPEKVTPIRRSPSLKLEGSFETMTSEQKEKFIRHLLGERPPLKKKSTLLKMEGDFDFLTEKQLKYVQHGLSERPRPRKRSTSLKLDGEVEFFPEYRSSYVDFPRSRPFTNRPAENLKNEGEFEVETETKSKYVDFQEFSVTNPAKPTNNLQVEGGLDIKPEYKENFVDFPRSRPLTMRPKNHLRQEGDFEMTKKNEILARFSTEDGQRPAMVRRPSNLKLEGEFEFSTEKQDKFKVHALPERLPLTKRLENIQLDGEFDFRTENEEKFVANAIPEPSDFRKRSSLLQPKGEFRSAFDFGRTSPREPLSPKPSRGTGCDTVRSKIIPFKTEHYALDSELMENCNRRRNSKRLKENLPDPFVTLPRTASLRASESGCLDNSSKFIHFPSKSPPEDRLRLSNADYCPPPRVKSPYGAQNRAFNIVDDGIGKYVKEKEESTSDDASDRASVSRNQPSFRLEVYNVDANPQGFHRGNNRVFPAEGIPSDTINFGGDSYLERNRNGYYEKRVDSPEVPKYLLDSNNNLGTGPWEMTHKTNTALNVFNSNLPESCDLSRPLNASRKLRSPTTATDRDIDAWSRPNWLTT